MGKDFKCECLCHDAPAKDSLNAIVRDYTSVSYIKVKSELRRRILELIVAREKEILSLIAPKE